MFAGREPDHAANAHEAVSGRPATTPTYIVIALVWLLSLATVGAFASGQLYRLPTTAEGRAKLDALTEPLVLSGSDIGFRVEGSIGDVPAGRLVIRINGEWVEPKASSQAGVVPVR